MLAVIDARRSQLFAALYGPRLERLWEPFVLEPAPLAERVATLAEAPLAGGDGSLRFRQDLEHAGAEVLPDADPGAPAVSAAHVPARGRPAGLGAGADSAHLPETTRCAGLACSEMIEPTGVDLDGEGLDVRRLTYSDLPAVLAIERRSFPTPWSLAMFVLELSKPSGICLAASGPDGLVGYLVCSRYADVWHLMNVAVDPERRRAGIATTLIERLFEEAGADARYTLEVRTSNAEAIAMYERFGFRPRAAAAATTTTTARTP